MGRRGPAPEPTAAKLARGETRPSRVNYESPVPRQELPVMPRDMGEDAKRVWRRVVRAMEGTGVITSADHGILRAYCEVEASYCKNAGLLYGSGSLIRGARGVALVVNPLVRVVNAEREAMRLLSRELGLTPAARAGLRIDWNTAAGDLDAVLGPAPRLRVVNGDDGP